MASKLTGKEFEKLRDQFFKMDQDKDGKVTKEELKAYCMGQNEYRTDDQIDYMMRVMDLDKSGTIEFLEFLEVASFFDYNKESYENQVKRMFAALDKNNDGYLSVEEIKQLWRIFSQDNCDIPSEEDLLEILDKLDVNGDGMVEYHEFLDHFDFDVINTM